MTRTPAERTPDPRATPSAAPAGSLGPAARARPSGGAAPATNAAPPGRPEPPGEVTAPCPAKPAGKPAAPKGGGGAGLAARLRDARIGVRSDLEFTRHVFRGEVAYVVRDPLTLASHRLGIQEYEILVNLDDERTLGVLFAELVDRKRLGPEAEEEFYRFVYSLHRLGFLALPLNDEKLLYRRAEEKRTAHARRWTTAIFSFQIPLWNPDDFLTRTMAGARLFLSRPAVALWFLVVGTAAWILARNWSAFGEPISNVFEGDNLPLLWITLIGLKLFHEFGHAWACKHFGGLVPEMGINLILFTPTAYVDASSSWTFTSRWQRLFVCLAGMYVELFLASLAVFVWTVTPPGTVHALAHNAVLLASFVTIAFNLNPLMRFDGYHGLCDLIEVPNLRARSTGYALGVLKRVLFGLRVGGAPAGLGMKCFFFVFGVGCGAYKVLLVLGICAAVATQFFALGVVLAAVYVGMELVRILRKVLPWLWSAEETAVVRARAVALSVFLFALLPVALAALPRPPRVLVPGVLGRTEEAALHAEADGVLFEWRAEIGHWLSEGAEVALLVDAEAAPRVAAAQARVEQAELRLRAAWSVGPSTAEQEQHRLEQARAEFAEAERSARLGPVTTPFAGEWLRRAPAVHAGGFVRRGDELGRIGGGPLCVRALCSQENWSRATPRVGDVVEFRAAGRPDTRVQGSIVRVLPSGEKRLETGLSALADRGGGSIAIDPSTQEASRAQFELVVVLDAGLPEGLAPGMRGVVRMTAPIERWGQEFLRRGVLFLQRLRESG